VHYRNGLTGLVKALTGDVEITLITMSPRPLMVVRPRRSAHKSPPFIAGRSISSSSLHTAARA
jgi:hypothetical protein